MNDVATAPSLSAPKTLVFEFHGQAGQYFRIWIVNIVLSILTLGIYSAWAKVRTKRYFYGSTVLDGASFEYHATPWQILKGRLIAVAVIAAYYGVNYLNPIAGYAMLLAWLGVLPWVINLSLRFNARVSSYRNVRFDFHGGYWRAVLVFLVLPIAAVLTVGILAPVAHRAFSHYLGRGFRFGGKPFALAVPLGRMYGIYLRVFGVLVLTALGLFALSFAFGLGAGVLEQHAKPLQAVSLALGFIFGITFYIAVPTLIRARVRNLNFSQLQLEGGHRFASGLGPWRMVTIVVTNLLAVVFSLGLATPWARIRMTRYVVEHTAVIPASDLSEFVSALPQGQQAFGAELADMAGIDIGI